MKMKIAATRSPPPHLPLHGQQQPIIPRCQYPGKIDNLIILEDVTINTAFYRATTISIVNRPNAQLTSVIVVRAVIEAMVVEIVKMSMIRATMTIITNLDQLVHLKIIATLLILGSSKLPLVVLVSSTKRI